MNILKNLRLRGRLLLMVLIPLAGMLWVSGWNTVEKTLLSREMGQLRQLVDVSTSIGALVHEIQKERGMSVGFLASGGVNFADKLPGQRDEASRRLDGYRNVLAGFDAGRHAGLPPLLAETATLLDGLSDKRKAVSSLALKPPEAGGYYTRTIAALLAIAGRAANLSSDRDIARLAATYHALLQAKERAGIERATLAGVFGDNSFSPESQVRFLSNAAAQDTWFTIFTGLANVDQSAFFKDKVTGPAVDDVARIKKEAIAKMRDPALGMDAKAWFAVSTQRIDLLKEVEDRLAGDLSSGIRALETRSITIASIYGLLTILSAILVLWLTWRIVAGILRQVGGEPAVVVEVARAIAAGTFDNDIELRSGDDASILASMKQMQGSLKDRIERDRLQAAETMRIKIALYSSTAAITISDAEGLLKNMTPTAERLLKAIAGQDAAALVDR
ncbi:MAG: nitrate- and nitrite sensing domain-containing protein, partial [Rhodocyclaceae bacterium]|nr:nitrate- and nitrite sensing domain-containing protein [Rhodocyclaceae bacterium]